MRAYLPTHPPPHSLPPSGSLPVLASVPVARTNTVALSELYYSAGQRSRVQPHSGWPLSSSSRHSRTRPGARAVGSGTLSVRSAPNKRVLSSVLRHGHWVSDSWCPCPLRLVSSKSPPLSASSPLCFPQSGFPRGPPGLPSSWFPLSATLPHTNPSADKAAQDSNQARQTSYQRTIHGKRLCAPEVA